MCLLDEVAIALRETLGKTEEEFPLVKVRDFFSRAVIGRAGLLTLFFFFYSSLDRRIQQYCCCAVGVRTMLHLPAPATPVVATYSAVIRIPWRELDRGAGGGDRP